MKKYTKKQINEWYNKYKKIKSITKVGKIFGIKFQTIAYCFKMSGLKVASRGVKKIYSCNDSFFSSDTPESFYWAGFLAADGCLTERGSGKYISVDLAIKDIDHVEKLCAAIQFNGKKHKSHNNKSVAIYINSSKMFDDLARFNIVPKKSLIYCAPNWMLDHKYLNHFLRGYYDGDGCISICKMGKRENLDKLIIHVIATSNMIEFIQKAFSKHLGFNKVNPIHKFNMSNLFIGGNKKTTMLVEFLYNNSTDATRLDRKFKNAFSDRIIRTDKYRSKYKPIVRFNKDNEFFYEAVKYAEKEGFIRNKIKKCCKNKESLYKGYFWRYATKEDIKNYSKLNNNT